MREENQIREKGRGGDIIKIHGRIYTPEFVMGAFVTGDLDPVSYFHTNNPNFTKTQIMILAIQLEQNKLGGQLWYTCYK